MPAFKERDDLKIQLDSKCGYKDFKDQTRKGLIILIPKGGDRIATLETVAKKLKSYGGRYDPNAGSSSVGRTVFNGGFFVECKIKGGGGSGAGSDLTALTESAQCVYSAALYNNKKYTHADLEAVKGSYIIDDKIQSVLTKLPDDWIVSSKIIAAKLKKEFPASGKNYVHHRGSPWVNKLEQHWKKLNQDAGKPFSNLNKWSPADTWMISSKGKQIDITRTRSLVELNNLLAKNLKSKDIVGVSLKKAVGTVSFKLLNTSKNRPVYAFEKATIMGKSGFFGSGDCYLLFDGGKAQFRKFGSTWQGELKGKNANMGKMSGGPVKALLDNITGDDFIPQRDLLERDEATIDLFYNWYSACKDTPKMKKYDFYAEVAKKDQNWFVSKILCTQLVSVVESMSKKDQDRFTSGMVNYAGSESELSGPYCKVY